MSVQTHAALIVIDVQTGIDEASHWGGDRNNADAESNIERLMKHWRMHNLPVVMVQHCSVSTQSPFWPEKPGNALKDIVQPQGHEKTIQKSKANAFVNTDLQKHLDEMSIKQIVIVGFVTNNSVEATARMAGDLGYKTSVVSDATAAFDKMGLNDVLYAAELVHRMSLANLYQEYADIVTTEEVIQSFA